MKISKITNQIYQHYKPYEASFSLASLKNEVATLSPWQTCREIFALSFSKKNLKDLSAGTKTLTFYSDRGGCALKFLNIIESKLKIKHSEILYKKGQLYVFKINVWWYKNTLRREFLTAALKAGRKYLGRKYLIKEDYEFTLSNNQYFQKTQPAVKKFLSGNTAYTHKCNGWVNHFSGLDGKKNLSKMVRPKHGSAKIN